MITHKPPVAEVDHERSSCGGEPEEPRIPTGLFPGGNIGSSSPGALGLILLLCPDLWSNSVVARPA
jgi:hypothetical protein